VSKTRKTQQNGSSRTGVFICTCNGAIEKNIDKEKLESCSRKAPGVAHFESTPALCEEKNAAKIAAAAKKHKLDRMILGACAEDAYEPKIRTALKKGGKGSIPILCANIREECAWVHPQRREATKKACSIIESSAERILSAQPLKTERLPVSRNVLILGGGLAGLVAAEELAEKGMNVVLAESNHSLGGFIRKFPEMYSELAEEIDRKIDAVKNHKKVRIITGKTLTQLNGQLGCFQAVIGDETIECGAVLAATGCESLSGLKAADLEASPIMMDMHHAAKLESMPQRLAIVLDYPQSHGVGTVEAALKLALRAREKDDADTCVICRYMHVSADGLDRLYTDARQAGAVFVKYEDEPKIKQNGAAVSISFSDPQSGEDFAGEFDLVCMPDVPKPDNGKMEQMRRILRTRGDDEGFHQTNNVWLMPVKSNRRGIFFAGSCRGDLSPKQCIEDGRAASTQIAELLEKKQMDLPVESAQVDEDKCVFCLTCHRVCPHDAIRPDQSAKVVRIANEACQACGICAAECPARAIQLFNFSDSEMKAETAAKADLLVFACENSAEKAAHSAGAARMKYSAGVRIVPVPCAGKVDGTMVVDALQNGAQRVMILACHEDACKYLDGPTRAKKRLERLREQMKAAGQDPQRLSVETLMSADANRFVELVNGI
jgi:heterodisulfide reductase subunit A-like polyferredoxin/coenzyme F420-reducing hydrogenase delta subunit